jgi:hypothetical protein
VFTIYVLGFVISYLAIFELTGIALVVLMRGTRICEPWKNSEWRQLASIFLGAELSPPVDEPPAVSGEALPSTNAEGLMKSLKENHAKRVALLDFQLRWQKWYDVLKTRFPIRQTPQQTFGNTYFSTRTLLAGPVSYQPSFSRVTSVGLFGPCAS